MGFFHPDRTWVYERVLRIAPLVCALLVVLGLALEQGLGLLLLVLMLLPVIYLADHSQRLARARIAAEQRHTRAIAELHLRTIEALAVAIDAKDNTTHEHLRRVVLYAEAIGKELQLPDDELNALRTAALLHDIGKLAVPEYIISKPGRLTSEEFEKMKTHAVVGAEILERVQFPYPVVPLVRAHHERWNGTGYPDGLRGTEIPLGARILAVVDCFDALASDRQYRRAIEPAQALEVIRKEAGETFDPRIVAALAKVFPQLEPVIARQPVLPDAAVSKYVRIDGSRAPQSGLAVEKADTSSALCSIAEARQELQVLYELTQALGNSLSVDETLQLLACQLQKLIRYDALAIYLICGDRLVPRFVEGVNASLLSRLDTPLGQGLSGWVAGNGKYSLNGNPAVEPGYLQDPAQFSKLRAALSVPLDSSKGIIGALTLYSLQPNAFTVDNLRILKTVGIKAGSTINNALIHEAMGRSADTDGLTGLPNARALQSRLEEETARAARQQTTYTVFVLDLNGLKQINDRHGHLFGNKVLKALATELRACLREYDFLARMGGDEFVILLPGMHAEAAAEKRLELALAVASVSKTLPEIDVSISMGAATYPVDGRNEEQILSLADRRMYWHKREFYHLRALREDTGMTGPESQERRPDVESPRRSHV
jgi:diguanylate cyclase (GGDEF)-like protein/putative nucleotidyltransferase with HDIG domain